MARIPRAFIDDLINRIDIVDVVDSYVTLRKAGRNHVACCPFHEEKTPSFSVNQAKQFYHCFGCGVHGNVVTFVMEYEGLAFVDAIHELAQRVGVDVPLEQSLVTTPAPQPDLYDLMAKAMTAYQQQLLKPTAQVANQYLLQRGLSAEIIQQFNLGYAPSGWQFLADKLGTNPQSQTSLVEIGLVVENDQGRRYDRFRQRVMFPLRDRRGRVIAFGARALEADAKPKYLNSPETVIYHKGSELYGLYEARQSSRRLDQLLVVEGYMDVLALVQHGINQVVATLGTATTETQVDQLFRASNHIIFCFDGDQAGRAAAWKALKIVLPKLREDYQVNFLFVADGEDPDSWVRMLGATGFMEKVIKATPLAEFLFEQVRQKNHIDIKSIDGRVRLVELLRPLLSNVPSIVRQGMLLRLAEVVNIDLARITTIIKGHDEQSAISHHPIKTAESLSRSPIRVAVALLLQYPELAQTVDNIERWQYLQVPGLNLLYKILELLKTKPKLSSGALLEYWRGSEDERHLLKLLQWQLNVPESGVMEEFKGALQRLDEQDREQRMNQLLTKPLHQLSADEKQELQLLLANH